MVTQKKYNQLISHFEKSDELLNHTLDMYDKAIIVLELTIQDLNSKSKSSLLQSYKDLLNEFKSNRDNLLLSYVSNYGLYEADESRNKVINILIENFNMNFDEKNILDDVDESEGL